MSDVKDKSEQLKTEVMRVLLARAADALEKKSRRAHPCDEIHELIDELRKATA